MMIKVTKRIGAILIIAIVCIIGFSVVLYSPEYMYRVLRYGESDVRDYLIFPKNEIIKSERPFNYSYEIDDRIGKMKVTYSISGELTESNLESFLSSTNTMCFIVIHDDVVVFEEYYNGYSESSINTSFSTVKSMVSLLVGIAIDEGHIKSEDQLVEEFIEELKGTEIGKVTIKDLLLMRSPIKYHEGLLWFDDDAKTYYMPDLRKLAISGTEIDPDYNGKFHYNNYHPLLLGIIIERSTGKSVTDYFEEKIWKKIGARYNASWSIDSKESRFEKTESGLNFRAIDFAKVGSMLLHKGVWNENRIVSEQWIDKSTVAEFPLVEEEYNGSFLENKETGYQYMWYSTITQKLGIDYYALGKYGQFLYISPENNTAIVRTGINSGEVDWWPDILKEVASKVANMN